MTDDASPENIEKLIEELNSDDYSRKRIAARALANIGESAVEPLIKALEDSDFLVRHYAAEALGKIGDTRAVEPLIKSGNLPTLKFQFGMPGLIAIIDAGKGDGLTVDELKQVLKKKKLSTSGTKKVLVRRLSYQDRSHKLEVEMAKDTSPKNISKLLESQGPSMIRMGLSMAKDSKVPDDMLGGILWLLLMHEESDIRTAAKSTFAELAPEEVRLIVKDNWRANYRTTKNKIGNNLYQLETKLKSVDFTIFEQLIKALDDEEYSVHASRALGLLKDERAVEPLIRIFKNKKALEKAGAAARGLGKIGNKQAVNTLFRALYGHKKYQPLDEHIAEALGETGDFRVVKPCVKEIEAAAFSERKEMSKSLLFNVLDSTNFSELKPDEIDEKLDALIILLHYEDAETKGKYKFRGSSGNYYTVTEYNCTCTGYAYRSRCRHKDAVRTGATKIKPELTSISKTALNKIVETNVKDKEKKNILKFLKSKDPAMVLMGASMLKGILEKK